MANLDIDFEPEREETVEWHIMSIGELVGVQNIRSTPDSGDDDADADH